MKKRIVGFVIILFALSLLALILVFYKKSKAPIPSEAICQDCNVILITMTNLRYDHMSSNGYFRPTTPNLDAFAKESLVFDNAFAHSSWTLPEGISIYTGFYPYQHGIMNRYDGSKLASNIPTLIDILNSNGYKTAAFTGGFDYNPEFGLTNRFLEYQECAKGQTASYPRQRGPRGSSTSEYGEFNCTIPSALDWLKINSNNKFFLHIQGFDAHCPFSQKGGYIFDNDYTGSIDYSECLWTFDRTKPIIKNGKTLYPVYSAKTGTSSAVLLGEKDIDHLAAVYDEAIRFADEKIGLFLREVRDIGLSENTIIIFTSEHGDMFGKHGRFMRGGPLRGTFYDDVLHIPLIIKNPKISAKKIDGLVGHVDLIPTLFDFLGLREKFITSGKNQVRLGKSLLPLILNNQEINEYIFAGSEFTPAQNNIYFSQKTRVDVVRNKNWKLIQETIFDSARENPSQTVELYNIVNDKEELNNLASTKRNILDNLNSRLLYWLKQLTID